MKCFIATVFTLFVSLSLPASSLAAGVRIIDAPATYQPGQSFTFDVIVPSMTSLSSYNIDVLITGSTGVVLSDFQVESVVPAVPASGYVFSSNNDFFAATFQTSAATQTVNLSDFDLTGVNTVIGVNDRIATVSVSTLASFQGDLQLSIDLNALILDGPESSPTPVPEFATILSDTTNQPLAIVSAAAVPEPGTCLLLATSSLLLFIHRRRMVRNKGQ
ncbi:hypothetical protein Poly51_44750 [Rubripirellula tenax]|uniref:PEP-CTERM protein-sorting domain-containing protein n=1 Tax=Rubripirellula tenax TaxID=2528015 RepID=A0A5C6EJI2_9BACT|nr:hypothetical protein [Rubripirellula tenax]TWU48575.1 hypothetical protein Poly51_44750 [Rubripirellula tenax]